MKMNQCCVSKSLLDLMPTWHLHLVLCNVYCSTWGSKDRISKCKYLIYGYYSASAVSVCVCPLFLWNNSCHFANSCSALSSFLHTNHNTMTLSLIDPADNIITTAHTTRLCHFIFFAWWLSKQKPESSGWNSLNLAWMRLQVRGETVQGAQTWVFFPPRSQRHLNFWLSTCAVFYFLFYFEICSFCWQRF